MSEIEEFILSNKYYDPWNWTQITKKSSIDDIEKYPNFPWDWKNFKLHDEVCPTSEFIIKFLPKLNFLMSFLLCSLYGSSPFPKSLYKHVVYLRSNNLYSYKIPKLDRITNYNNEIDGYYRTLVRTTLIKEELLSKVFEPSRVEKWLDIGGIELVECMFGNND